jgi:hypothetical protein
LRGNARRIRDRRESGRRIGGGARHWRDLSRSKLSAGITKRERSWPHRPDELDHVAFGIADHRSAAGVLEADELPIADYDTLNVSEAVAEIKELATPADVRAVLAYEEAHKNRHGVVSAAQTRVAAIAQEVVGIT